jgi:hypothetical protein
MDPSGLAVEGTAAAAVESAVAGVDETESARVGLPSCQLAVDQLLGMVTCSRASVSSRRALWGR